MPGVKERGGWISPFALTHSAAHVLTSTHGFSTDHQSHDTNTIIVHLEKSLNLVFIVSVCCCCR